MDHAETLYSFALNATGGRKVYQKSVPEAAQAYLSSGFGDELAIAALFLSWATDSTDHYVAAEDYWSRYELQDRYRVFNWDSKTPALPVLFAQIAKSRDGLDSNLTHWQGIAERYFDGVVAYKAPSYGTSGENLSSAWLRFF